MAASPRSAVTRIPEDGQTPAAGGASSAATLVTSATLTRATGDAPGGRTHMRTVPRTVLPGPTARTVSRLLLMTSPVLVVKSKRTVYVSASVPSLVTSYSAKRPGSAGSLSAWTEWSREG